MCCTLRKKNNNYFSNLMLIFCFNSFARIKALLDPVWLIRAAWLTLWPLSTLPVFRTLIPRRARSKSQLNFHAKSNNLLPGITRLLSSELLSGSVQANERIHLCERQQGFIYGDAGRAMTWSALVISDSVGISEKLPAEHISGVSGADRDLVKLLMIPPMGPNDCGRTCAEAGLGLNFFLSQDNQNGDRSPESSFFKSLLRVFMKIKLLARFSAGAFLLASCLPASAQDTINRDSEEEASEATPLETLIVVGYEPRSKPNEDVTTPVLEGRLATLEDLLRDTPGVQIESVFGGIDHPRFSIRGSGLQRGTQPPGRGIELRLDGLPITYADTSFDFVEFLEPLFFGEVSILRGGRGALEGGSTLGGIVDFRGRSGIIDPGLTARGEIGSFDYLRGQAAYAGSSLNGEGFGSVSWFSQDGFREFGAQEALRAYGRYSYDVSDRVTLRISGLANDSELELPGPQTLAQIDAGSKAAQPNGILGDWRRFTDQYRLSSGISVDLGGPRIELDAAYMVTDVEFRRRDVQVEDNDDFTFAARLRDNHEADLGWGATIIYQRNDRRQQQFFNGGGTPPTFSGARGDQWGDNDLSADRLTAQLRGHVKPADNVRLDFAAGWDWHGRNISDNFAGIRAERPVTQLDDSYDGFNGLALLSVDIEPRLTLFTGVSHVIEPPTYDVLLINASGMPGPNNALLDGPNPRRPVVRQLDEQTAITAEAGIRGEVGNVRLDFTLYRAWIDNEIVSTANFVEQRVTSVGNADDTRRWGIESSFGALVAEDIFRDGDHFDISADWTWTEARFDNDPIFGDNFLPIVVEHRFGARAAYRSGRILADLFITYVPDGGFADYENTLRADGYATLGARVSYDTGRFLIFVEGRNLTDARYVSSVIAAQNNLEGNDFPTFAPGEPAAVTVGLQARF